MPRLVFGGMIHRVALTWGGAAVAAGGGEEGSLHPVE